MLTPHPERFVAPTVAQDTAGYVGRRSLRALATLLALVIVLPIAGLLMLFYLGDNPPEAVMWTINIAITALAVGYVCVESYRTWALPKREAKTRERLEKLAQAYADYREKNGRFPESAQELGLDDGPENRDAICKKPFLHAAGLGVRVEDGRLALAAPVRAWRIGFATRRALVLLDDLTVYDFNVVAPEGAFPVSDQKTALNRLAKLANRLIRFYGVDFRAVEIFYHKLDKARKAALKAAKEAARRAAK